MRRKIGSFKKYLAMEIVVSVFVAFSFFVFGPLEIVLSEPTEFWFEISDVLGECFLSAFCCFIALMTCMFLASFFGERVHFVIISLIAGIGLALYIQGHFINTDYGILDGHTIDWNSYKSVAVCNSALWVGCLVLPIILYFWKPQFYKKGITIVLICLLLVQILSIGALFVTTNGSKPNTEKKYLSTAKLDEVSKEENVVIFILDTFDADYLEEIYQTDKEFLDPLDGFVWFDNATCMYPTTNGSLPYILTNKVYKNETGYQQYVDEAYKTTNYYHKLKEQGFTIGLYTDPKYVSDNNEPSIFCNYVKDKPVASSKVGLCGSLYKLTAFRFFPHILKQYFWLYSGEFDNWKASDKVNAPVYSENNLQYYNYLLNNKLHFADSGKSYKVIHLSGTHLPYTIKENMEETTDGSATYMSEAKASLKIVYEYLEQLHKLNVYDDALFIITADHGAVKGEPTSPILLVKLPNAKGFIRNSAPVGHADLQGTIMTELALNNNNEYGKSVFEYHPDEDRKREYYYYTLDIDSGDLDHLPPMTEYVIDSKNNNLESFHLLKYKVENYHLGDQLSFVNEGPAYSYVVYGVGSSMGTYPWTNGKQMILAFNLDNIPQNDLLFHLNLHGILNGKQHVIASVNGETVYSDTLVDNASSIEFVIPKNTITENLLEISFELPDAISPAEIGMNDDIHILALWLSDITIEETDYSPK